LRTIIVYLNGDYLPVGEARVSVNDRGFLFADAVYEAIPAYAGRCFLRERHLARLAWGLRTLRIEADVAPLADVGDELIARNDLSVAEFSVFYMQVTRGAAPTGSDPGDPAGEPAPTDAGAGVEEPPATPAWRTGDR